jgi:cysteine sulfinate desulfinase/cysteine desulfurase-like protein
MLADDFEKNVKSVVDQVASSAVQMTKSSAAMGVSADIANAALRLSLGCLSTDADVPRTLDVLVTLADKARVGKAASAACAFEPVEF